MKHNYFERLREREPHYYSQIRQITAAGQTSQFCLLPYLGIQRENTEEASQFIGSFLDGLTYVARRFGTEVTRFECSPENGVDYQWSKDLVRLGRDIAQMGVKGIINSEIRFLNPKLPDMPLTAKELAFSFGVEESFHAHDAKTNRASFIASLKLQKQRGITSPLHPEYNLFHTKKVLCA